MNKQTRGIIYIIVCGLLWSTGGLFIKMISWNSLVIASLRSLIAAVVLYIDMAFIMKTPKIIINRQTLANGFFLGSTMVLFVAANKLTTAANAIVLQSVSTILIIIYSALILKKTLPLYEKIVAVVGIFGTVMFFFDQLTYNGMLGNIIALVSAFTFAGVFITSSKAKDKQTSNSGLILGQLCAFIVGFPFLFIYPPNLELISVSAIIFLGVFQLGVAYSLFGRGTRLCPPVKSAIGAMIEPICSPIWVALFANEVPGPMALVGGVLVISSLTVWGVLNAKETTEH